MKTTNIFRATPFMIKHLQGRSPENICRKHDDKFLIEGHSPDHIFIIMRQLGMPPWNIPNTTLSV